MASSARTKRLAREVPELRKKNPSYFVSVDDQDITSFHAYILGPDDSCYAGKLVKLKIEVPASYPFKPPNCTFVQHNGGRIHPNLYNTSGRVCLSILGTWSGPGWAFTMTIDTVLITIQSLLDAKPLSHEPGMSDSKSYNDYVRYTTWRWLLLDYVDSESDVASQIFLQSYMKEQGPRIWQQLQSDKNAMEKEKSVSNWYGKAVEIVDWTKLENDLRSAIVNAGGSIIGSEGANKFLSFGQVAPESLTTAATMEKFPSAPAMQTAHKKRKLDAVEPNAIRPDPSKKQATSTGHTSAAHKPSHKTKTSPTRPKQHETINLVSSDVSSDDEAPARKQSCNKSKDAASSLFGSKKTNAERLPAPSKPKEVILLDDD